MREHALSNRGLIWLVLGFVALVLLWYFFRPERLFINKTVEEPPPHGALTPPALKWPATQAWARAAT
jgi:hypothetical protein